MAIQSHIETLKVRHRELDTEIQQLSTSTSLDAAELNDLKRKKLQIKDRIEELSAMKSG